MARRSMDEVVERAYATFDNGDRRAAWSALRDAVRRQPLDTTPRRALVALYRRAGHPDQAARWGAHEPGSLTDHERRILERAVRRLGTEHAVREYLVLPGAVPDELVALFPPRSEQRRRRFAPVASEFLRVAAVAGVLAGAALLVGLGITTERAFRGLASAQSAAQMTCVAAVGAVAFVGALTGIAAVLRGWWIRAGLLVVVVVAAVVVFTGVDMRSELPFGR